MAKSWSWSLALTAAVADQATVEVPTPGYDAERTDTSSVQLAVGAQVVDDERFDIAFNGDAATLTNLSGQEWPAGATVYVYVEAQGIDDIANGDLAAMQAEIDALKAEDEAQASEIADLQTRVAALEAVATGVTAKQGEK